jgi:hypothetical protein
LRTVGALLEGSGAHRSRTARAHLEWVALSNPGPEVLARYEPPTRHRHRTAGRSRGAGA